MVVVATHVVVNGVVVPTENTLNELRVHEERDDKGKHADDEGKDETTENLETERGLHTVVTETVELAAGVAAVSEDGGHCFSPLSFSLG